MRCGGYKGCHLFGYGYAMVRHLVEGGPCLRPRTFYSKLKGFFKEVICEIRFYSAYHMIASEVMKINFSIKRAAGMEKDFGSFDKFNTMLISWFLNDENSVHEEIKLILTKMCHEFPNNLHDSAM